LLRFSVSHSLSRSLALSLSLCVCVSLSIFLSLSLARACALSFVSKSLSRATYSKECAAEREKDFSRKRYNISFSRCVHSLGFPTLLHFFLCSLSVLLYYTKH
jgi:hypothetical protein